MLQFNGFAFSQSPVVQSAYAPFLNNEEGAYAYLSLRSSDTSADEAYIRLHGTTVSSGTTEFSFLPDLSKCVVNSSNYRLLAEENFSRVMVRSSYLRNMSHASFLRLNEAIYQLARIRALYLDMLVLHASAIVYNDEVIMFSGMKGAGKSTQARLWLENTDAWVLNYDKPIAKLDGERVVISGSPWGGKEDLAVNEVRPAKALFFVHQAKENRVVRLSAAKAYAQAHLNYFVYPLNEDIEKRYNNAVIQLIKKVPVYDLYCTDTAEAVEAVRRVLYTEEE